MDWPQLYDGKGWKTAPGVLNNIRSIPFTFLLDREGRVRYTKLRGEELGRRVEELLSGKANVHRPLTNCGPTTKGVKELEKWLGDKPWDVIHFNFGLHDLKYLGAKGQNLADPKAEGSHQQVPIADYEKHLRTMVARLEKTGARLIWRTTTPVPPGARGRVVGDSVKYNAVAAKLMKERKIAIDDMYSFTMPRLKEIMRPANVHFTPAGSKALAKQAAAAITAALKKPSKASGK